MNLLNKLSVVIHKSIKQMSEFVCRKVRRKLHIVCFIICLIAVVGKSASDDWSLSSSL